MATFIIDAEGRPTGWEVMWAKEDKARRTPRPPGAGGAGQAHPGGAGGGSAKMRSRGSADVRGRLLTASQRGRIQ